MERTSKRSYTAEGVAALRAAGRRERSGALRNPDYLAEHFLPLSTKLLVRISPLRRLALRRVERQLPGLYHLLTARTKLFDSLLRDELRSAARQVVIVGAGADTRAYRFVDELAGARVVEVDHPATSAWKQSHIRKLYGRLPEHVRYLPIVLGSQSLDTVLPDSGVDLSTPTLFLCEGLFPYLSADSVAAVLDTVSCFAPGSSIAFEYVFSDTLATPAILPDAQKYATYLRDRGEPLAYGVNPNKVAGLVSSHGLKLVSNTVPEDFARLYLQGAGSTNTFTGIAHAQVAPSR